ncbi:MAG: 4'-phosphopantetheinyl transferase superfamily protein [Thiogranum sp.]|nr:4'-phosphopantetheinyl transferase superfamily protein [Thiogranum sp.]
MEPSPADMTRLITTNHQRKSLLNALRTEAHVWYAAPELFADSATVARCESVLSGVELLQYRRFRFPESSRNYLIAHAMVRLVLSRYGNINPADWTFVNGEHGRPEVSNPRNPALRFNLTHTAGLAACVVTRSRQCGIDAEAIVERHHPLQVARRMFSETEYRRLQALEGREHLEYFFKQWTLREAYVKARGIGISFPTRELCFDIADESNITVEFHTELGDRDENWHFKLLHLTPGHIAAVAIGRDGQGNNKVIARPFDFHAMQYP